MADPRRIRPEELSKAVAKAVDLARAKHKLELHPHLFQQDFAHLPWWIVGRVLRERVDLDQAHKVSETITQSINAKSDAFQPATVRIGDDILVGFIERFGNQIELPNILGGGPQQF
ncbi:MAG: hypothetical protein IT454_12355 [Planctomycetes bacterium]|nr:hypothetical protein [Planctomycetota bacterium]